MAVEGLTAMESMESLRAQLRLYNTLTRTKESFVPLCAPHVGMYVCGPTVYGEPHLGHARSAVTFDVLYRLLLALGYRVRYVRNITDVGHLVHDQDAGEDKIEQKARLENLEPMEVAHRYTVSYHRALEQLNTLPPSIEPLASGHIIEQVAYIQRILAAGFAYEVDGSVYFDIEAYNRRYHYGELSGRRVEDLLANTRALEGQQEKRNPLDFALWKRADASHIMRWPSPWGEGYPGWHLECSTMGQKYLGEEFDIHGGGLDLMFPHHECEIAQARAAQGRAVVRYWLHNNMVTLNGQKMGKSLGNFITLHELFTGTHPLLERPYSPMTMRFFILQAHYRSTLDFSNAALVAAGRGLERLWSLREALERVEPAACSSVEVDSLLSPCWQALLDDMNTPVALSHLFGLGTLIQELVQGKARLTAEALHQLKQGFDAIAQGVLGLRPEGAAGVPGADDKALEQAMKLVLKWRAKAKEVKDYATSDAIRDAMQEAGVEIQDTPDGAIWRRS